MVEVKKEVLRSSENVIKVESNTRDGTQKPTKVTRVSTSRPSSTVQPSLNYRHHYNHIHSHPHHYSYYHHGQHQFYQHQPYHHSYHHAQPRPKQTAPSQEKPASDEKHPVPPLISRPSSESCAESVQEEPKRPRSAFICFKDSKKKEIMEREGITKESDGLLKIFANAWGKLSEKEKAYWDEEARNDKVRFVREKAKYKGRWKVPKRRAKKHPGAPKRPMSAFLKFSKTRRKTVKEQNPDVSNTDVSRLLGEIWRKASDAEKKPYQDNELLERKKYKEAMKKWRESQAQLHSATRTTHDSTAQIFRHNQQQPRKATIHSHQHVSAFDRYRDPPLVVPGFYEQANLDPLLEEEAPKRQSYSSHAQAPFHYKQHHTADHAAGNDYFFSDSHHQSSWPELTLEPSLDQDSDPLPIVPGMHSSVQTPKTNSTNEEYLGGHASHKTIYFPESTVGFPRF